MALSADGQLFTWGWNGDGELGNGSSVSFTNVPVAVNMTGVLAGKTIAALGAGNMHFLVATTDGEVFAWGFGPDGELGNGETKDSRVPVAVNMSGALAGKSVVAVSGGWEHSMALTADGLVYTWGANYEGQLGTGTFASSAVPVAVNTTGVLAGQTIAAIAGGKEHGLALSAAGQVYGWGDGSRGELGDGNNSSSAVPINSSAFAPLAGTYRRLPLRVVPRQHRLDRRRQGLLFEPIGGGLRGPADAAGLHGDGGCRQLTGL